MEVVIIEERTKNIKTKDSLMSSCNRISDSESNESVGGIQRRVCKMAYVVYTWDAIVSIYVLFVTIVTTYYGMYTSCLVCVQLSLGVMLCFFTTHCSLRLIVRSELDVPTFATRRLHACHHTRAPSG